MSESKIRVILKRSLKFLIFATDVILLCWIKFTYFSKAASIAATAIMGPVLVIILLFGVAFYRKITKHQYVISTIKFEVGQEIIKNFNQFYQT